MLFLFFVAYPKECQNVNFIGALKGSTILIFVVNKENINLPDVSTALTGELAGDLAGLEVILALVGEDSDDNGDEGDKPSHE